VFIKESYLAANSPIHKNDFITWDVPNWTRALNYLERNKNQHFENKIILELGGSNASLSLWAASKGGRVICSDIKNPDKAINKESLTSKYIKYEIIDALNIPYKEHFDFILFKSLLGGIGRSESFEKQILVMNQIKSALKKGGECLFIENIEGSIFHQIVRSRYGAGKNKWYYPNLEEFQILSKIFRTSKYNTYGILGSSGKYLKRFRTKFDKSFDGYFPKSWRYIYTGIYKK
tara:strand:- start:1606 stop:2304 length:699 start_codon:yes stop_codon:yes gene_type:complete